MPTVHEEVELKYAVEADFEVPALTELLGSAQAPGVAVDASTSVVEGATAKQRLVATYFDTPDLRLAHAGLTLRRRTGGDDAGWHLKVPTAPGVRSEVRLPLGRSTRTVPQRLQQMVWACTSGQPLVAVAKIATDRTIRRLVDATGRVVAEVADDRVSAQRLLALDGAGDAAGALASWRELEVELVNGDRGVLAAADSQLRARGLQLAASASKLARVLGISAADPTGAGKVERQRLSAKSSAGEVLSAYVEEQVEQVRAQDVLVRLDATDSLHKMRVATRRLRSALTTFKPLMAAETTRPLRQGLKWLAAELGIARDAEVMRDRVAGAVQADGDDVAPTTSGHDIDAELGQVYRNAHEQVLAVLDGQRYRALLTALGELLVSPSWTAPAQRTAGKVLPRLVARSYKELRSLVEEAAAEGNPARGEELLHDARKAAKRARYAAESVRDVFGKDATTFAHAMEAVQEALGEHQDSVLTRKRLQELAAATSSPAAAFTYGRLHALEEINAGKWRKHFDTAWAAASRKKLHRWL